MCVPKDLANHWTDMVFLYRIVLIDPGKVNNYFGGGFHHPLKRNRPYKKIIPSKNEIIFFLFKTTI